MRNKIRQQNLDKSLLAAIRQGNLKEKEEYVLWQQKKNYN